MLSEIKWTDADVCQIEDWIPAGEYNPHNVRPWLLHDHGFVLAVVFAGNLQEALDIACDCGKLEQFLIEEPTEKDYDTFASLGNAGELHDIESVSYEELINPKLSFLKCWS